MRFLQLLAELESNEKSAVRMAIIAAVVVLIGVGGAYFATDAMAKRVIIGLAAIIALLFVLVGFDII
jgi:hypothetical protein